MKRANNNIPGINDRPITKEGLDAMYQRWLSQENDLTYLTNDNFFEVEEKMIK